VGSPQKNRISGYSENSLTAPAFRNRDRNRYRDSKSEKDDSDSDPDSEQNGSSIVKEPDLVFQFQKAQEVLPWDGIVVLYERRIPYD
jgi:hypothetical protein